MYRRALATVRHVDALFVVFREMGCHDLWKCLATAGLIESLKGGTRGDYERILKELRGKIVAVDCSVWLFEVKSVAQLRKSFASETAAFVKVIFEKATDSLYDLLILRAISDVQISNMLRLGCTPVLVFEGEVDKSKYELMERRSIGEFHASKSDMAGASLRYQRAYTSKGHRNRFSELQKFVKAMVRPVIQYVTSCGISVKGVVTVNAPGEGEAMCAALDALGPSDLARCRYLTH